MAILGSTTLTGCNYIPDFIGSGYHMVFENASAPTSWTKVTTLNSNGVALRVVTGTASTGGSLDFSSCLGIRQLSATFGDSNFSSVPGSVTLEAPFPAAAGGAGFTVGAIADLPDHEHQYTTQAPAQVDSSLPRTVVSIPGVRPLGTSSSTGSSQSHSHSITKPQHTHTLPGASRSHSHTVTSTPHTHSVVISETFDVYYIDVIIASKD